MTERHTLPSRETDVASFPAVTDAEVAAAVEPIKNLLRAAGRDGIIWAAQRATEFTRNALEAAACARPAPAAEGEVERLVEELRKVPVQIIEADGRRWDLTATAASLIRRLLAERDDARWGLGKVSKQFIEMTDAHDALAAQLARPAPETLASQLSDHLQHDHSSEPVGVRPTPVRSPRCPKCGSEAVMAPGRLTGRPVGSTLELECQACHHTGPTEHFYTPADTQACKP